MAGVTSIDAAQAKYGGGGGEKVVRFSGFSTPVDNPPTINGTKAGKNIALKWHLLDANGAPVTNLSFAGLLRSPAPPWHRM